MSFEFDATTHEGEFRAGWQPIPAGKYLFVIDNAEEVPTKAGTGSYLQLDCKIVGGEQDGKVHTIRLNTRNPNPTAVRIAQDELKAICLAIGVMKLSSHDFQAKMIGKQFRAKVEVKKRKDDETKFENFIAEYAKKAPATPPQPQPAAKQDAPELSGGEGSDDMW